jgi:predicted phage terminase large subunit-like protein
MLPKTPRHQEPQAVPHAAPQVSCEAISGVKRSCAQEELVYDLQVEGSHNFFAEGILAHNCIIVDDPVKNAEEADSLAYRRRAVNWWNTTLYTRAEPGASIVLLMTRWHQADLGGYLKSPENESHKDWLVINLPALAEEGDALGRSLGAALCPARYDAPALEKIKTAVGTRAWNALYQQRPSAEQGNLIKREWWQEYSTLPQVWDEQIISGDLTFTGKATSDMVVFQVWGRLGAQKYLLDQVRGTFSFTRSLEVFMELCRKWPLARRRLIENKANGPALEDQLKKHVPGIILWEPRGDKVARVNAATPTIEAGNCYLPSRTRGAWVEGFVTECADFPNGVYDDQVDTMSQALAYFDQRRILPAPTAGHG